MPSTTVDRPLAGLRILIVEDNYLVADGISECLLEAGAVVVAVASERKEALSFVDGGGIHVVIVDVNLDDGPSYDLATRLLRLKLPFFFVSGFGRWVLPPEFEAVPCLEKPFSEEHLIRLVGDVAGTPRPSAR